MILLYIILGAIILYFVIKYSVRNAILEADFKKNDKESNEIEKLLSEIMSKKNEVIMLHDSKEMKHKAIEITNESLKVYSSSMPTKEKADLLESYRDEIISLQKLRYGI